ncbi:hypothetical protein CDD81_2934 [Ophiocordyceps australis]|uniref:Cell cycle inhibitor Nif1 n=1 Tax=Ophiocordyceps australis TaxID=1399860 RepID=A0A2C5YCC8_9HYPO|nr:hypothetical protein CDD81_2934 [Ophiocordyceps australis]
MVKRPGLLDLRADSSQSTTSSSSKVVRSPRLHVAGEAPPELSPLDAFALQSRLLAKQLQESTRDGNRISRLPPLTAESPLVQQGRLGFFRSLSHDATAEQPQPQETVDVALKTEVQEAFAPEDRPRSMHPRMSRIPPTPEDTDSLPMPDMPQPHAGDASRGRRLRLNSINSPGDYFGARKDRSPSPIHSAGHLDSDQISQSSPRRQQRGVYILNSPSKPKQVSYDELGLTPSMALHPGRSPSVVSSAPGDDDISSNPSASFHSLRPRKLSAASVALSQTIPSPATSAPFARSPPISRADTPSLDQPTRQASSDSQPSFVLADESAHTPVSMHSETFMDHAEDGKNGAPSYIYSTFLLPRGKTLERPDHADGRHHWDKSTTLPSPGQQSHTDAPPSPPTRPSSSATKNVPDDTVSLLSTATRPSMEQKKTSMDGSRLSPSGYASSGSNRPSAESSRSEGSPRGRSTTASHHDNATRGRPPPSAGTSDSASTIRPPPTARSMAPSASEISAEEHLAKGIECHENGSLNESTYHLRHAARQNHPTAMLLYALACRHGWGMRANQKEGVQWLRKAAEYASNEIAGDEDRAKEGKPSNFLESKTRKAQFALSVYELGVSHMNGWGIEQDKALALRCFEIAGNWGDVDALAEAGFCYAQGLGCKKDLRKSAKFYRMAEAKGMTMPGNSWIHKAKYQDDDDACSKEKHKRKGRSKSRTRTMFGRK